MYSLYVDTAKNNVCHGCLSVDRNVTFLEANVGLFYSLLEQKHVFDTKIMLCWECKAFLRNTEKFQKRIQEAQCLLQDAVTTLNELCVNLSTLSYTKKDVYDHLIQYHDDKILQFENEPDHKEEPVNSESFNGDNEQTNIHIKQEVDDFNDTTYDNDYHSTDGEERIEVKESKKHINTYLDKVIITSTDIDSEDLKTYCCRVTLNDKEIDEMLDKSYRETQKSVTQRRPFKCKECKNEYKKELDYQRHYTFNHMKRAGRVTCKHCKKSFASYDRLIQHWNRHMRYYRCTICGWTSNLQVVVIQHINVAHTKIFTCVKCEMKTSTVKDFKKHYKEAHLRIVCDHCGKSFIKKRSLETHIKRHHLPPTCELCNKTYSQYHNLDNHYRLNHPELLKLENKELAYCVECNKQFPSVYKYKRHLASAAVHTPPKIESVPCPECGKVFSRKIRMTNHVMSVHKKNTKHRCDICNKTFCSAYSARTHRQCVHEKIPLPKNKYCDICGRGFSTNRILTNHRRTHTGERPYQCPHCPATFAQRIAMKTHAKTQHKNLSMDIGDLKDPTGM